MNNKKMDSFRVNFANVKDYKKDIELKLSAYEVRAAKLAARCAVGDVDVANSILKLTRDPKQLLLIADVVKRISMFIADWDKTIRVKTTLDTICEYPDDLAWLAGDFGAELDTFLSTLSNPKE